MEFSGSGSLYIRAFTASDALPVEGVLVRIRGANEENRLEEHSRLTDRNGLTERVILAAPSKNYSLASGAAEAAFAEYNVEVFGEGYYSKRFLNVAIFDQTEAVLPVAMIPKSEYVEDGVYPKGNLEATVEENEFLQ